MRRSGLLALGLALLTGATATVNQGAPGHQGPWPVFISTLPDGGGGIQMVPCPFTVTEPDGGIAEFVDCDGSINWNQFNPTILWGVDPVGTGVFNGVNTLVSLPDGGTLHGLIQGGTFQTDTASESTPGYAYRSAAGLKWQSDDSDANNYTHSGGVHSGTYNNEWYTSDGGYCFHDGTCQTTAAGTGFFQDAGPSGSAGAIVNNNSGPVQIGSNVALSGGGELQVTGSAASIALNVTDGTSSFLVNFNGSKVSLQSSPSRQLDLAPNGSTFFRADPGTITNRSFVPLDMISHKITALSSGSASDDAAAFGQVQETVAISGATLPGLSPANNLVIGSMKSNAANGNSLTRASISITCLVAGVGAGSTAVNINDATSTAGNPQVSVTEACACTPGAVTNASVTGLSKTDTDQFNLALKSTAATDCATYPLFIVNGQVTLQ